MLILSFISFLTSLILFLINSSQLSPPLIFHFDAYRGIDLTGNFFDFWLIFFFGFLSFLINSILSEALFFRERGLTYILLGNNLFISVLILIMTAIIIKIN